MSKQLDKTYDPKKVEDKIYRLWEKSGYFNPDKLPGPRKKLFTIIMPPSNANGHLHAGHALVMALEDIMTRYKRMRGFKTLWVPGADHAGFETQVVYERKLEKEGRSRFKMDPEKLFDEIMTFTLENKKYMEEEVKRLGASCDWSREKFTLDEDVIRKTQITFKKMYDDGLVYRGLRTVNWCIKHQTSLSDVETESSERNDKLYYIKYGPFAVATVRPETIFGDVAIALNPKDERYKKHIGKEVEVENPNGKLILKVIADESVDMNFGTGALKITPAHDHNDFLISQKHGLKPIVVIDQFGRLNEKAGKYTGMKILEAREKVVEDLTQMGLIEKIEDYTHSVPICYKCGTVIEPRLLPQWFVKMKPLAELAIKAVEKNKIKFIPENYKKIFLYWMKNTIDWNISRQIVWGIRIPAWFCMGCGEVKMNPKIKSRWFLVRHGETDWNRENRYQGHSEVPLNEEGRRQAKVVSERLRDKNMDLVISSDLIRSRETAEIISKEIGAELLIDKRLRERNGGEWEGLQLNEIIAKNGFKFGPNFPLPPEFNDFKPSGGENWKEVETRIMEALHSHKAKHHHRNVLIVTHFVPMVIIHKNAKNLSDKDASLFTPKNTDIIELTISEDRCKKCGGDLIEQDPDTFDTWFSSGQWPLLALNFPNGKDFKEFYPTEVMETGRDLIFKWIPRMVIFGLYLAKKVPFKIVYLHGLVNDARGKKMSKSKGNVVNPLDLIDKFGADALRIGLVAGNAPGNDAALSEDKIRGYRNFSTKIWNVARFVLMNYDQKIDKIKPKLSQKDKKNLADFEKVKKKITKDMDDFKFHQASKLAYHYIWHAFADKIIEDSKSRLRSENIVERATAFRVDLEILSSSLKLLHPFMPFITEEIYQQLPIKNKKLLLIEKW